MHDHISGFPGSYTKVIQTLEGLLCHKSNPALRVLEITATEIQLSPTSQRAECGTVLGQPDDSSRHRGAPLTKHNVQEESNDDPLVSCGCHTFN